MSLSFTDNGTYSFDGGIRLANDDTTLTIDKAQVTVSGRGNDTTNIYQLKNVSISNGGKLTANLDNINSFTGAFDLGYSGSEGTLELNLGAGLAREFSLSDVNFSGDGTLVKSGAGSVTFTGSSNTYFGEAKVSGGTLVVPSTTTMPVSLVTVESEATFKSGANLTNTEFVLNGGSYVVGDTSASSEVTIGNLTLNGGRICFDFNEASDSNDAADWLMVSSATLNSGYVDLTFNVSTADQWWDYINSNYANGFSLIQGYIVDVDQFDPTAFAVTVNGAPSNSWELEARSGQLLLYAVEGEDPQVDPWYDANSSDTSLPNWTITGTDRVGAKFTDGGSEAEYSKEVIMNGNGQFDVNSGRNLTLSNTISGNGSVTKIGEGTLILAANNSYAGGTTISAGVLKLTDNGTLGTGGVVNNAVLELAHDSAATIGNVISGSGSVAMTGAGTVTLSGDNSYSGGTTISAGTLKIAQVSGLGTGPVTINGGTLDTTAAGSGQTFNYDLTIGANGGTVTAAGSSYSTFKSVSGSGDLTTNGYVLFNGGGNYNGHVTVKNGYMCIKPDSFGVFDLTLDGGQVNVAEAGTIHIGKLNAPNGGSYLFGSNENNQYVFEIGVGTTSTDVATYGSAIRGNNNGAYNVTIKKVGEGTQIFNRTGYAYSGTPNSIKEVIVDGGKMIIDANNTDAFKASNTNGFWGTAPITVNSGGTLEFKRSWTTAPNVQMTINGGTLTLSAGQYLNKVTLNSGTVDGSNDIRAGYNGTGVWTVKGGTSTIKSNVLLVLKGDYKTFTINFDKDATLDVKKTVYGLDGYTGTAVTFKGTGDGPGNILIRGESGTIHNLGNITFNNMNGSIAAPITGTSAVIKSGAGTVTLSGANTYTGATTVSGGTLVLASSGSLASNVTVASGASFVDGASSITSNVTINGGTFTIGDTSAASRITIGDFALTSGTVNFDFNSVSTANNYDYLTTGAATLTSGSINLTFNNGDEAAWWNNVSDSGYVLISSTALTANLDNIALLINNTSGTENWYLDTADNALVLKKADGPEPPEPPVTLDYYYANTDDITADKWTIDGTNKKGAKFLEGDQNTATFANPVELNANGSFEVAENRNLTVAGVISGNDGLEKTGAGKLTLSGDNTYTGETTVTAGTLELTKVGKKGTLPTGSTINVNGATSVLTGHGDIFGYGDETVGTINLTNGGTLHNDSTGNHITMGAVVNMNNGFITAEDGWGSGTFGNYVFDNAINVLGGTDNAITANKITLRQYDGTPGNGGGKITVADGAKLTITSQIADPDGYKVPLIKQGAGTLVLSGDCTYTTGTFVNAGTLELAYASHKGTLATGSTVTVDGATSVLTGHGDIFGYGDQSTGTINLTNGATLHNNSTDAHITVGAAINMNNGFITSENGGGNDTFGNYVFDNAINVLGGTDNAITANKITLRQYNGTPGNGGGKFTVAENAKLTVSSIIRAEGVPLVKLGAGELVLTETNTYGTGTTVSEGKLTLTNSGTLGTGNVENNALIEFAQNSDVTIGNAISGTGAVVKTGSGTVTMSGDSYYTGGTTVSAGTLELTHVSQKGTLATGSTVTVDGATSVLTGHGDIFGYGDQSTGTINLTNGATLHNNSTGNHITMGPVVNMNNGFITAENGMGHDTYGNYVFDNAINVLGGTNNAITANKISLRQYPGTPGDGGGKITVADGAALTISSQIDDADGYTVPLVKLGEGTLILTGDNTYSHGTTVSAGTLQLTKVGKKGALATGSAVTVDGAASVLTGHGDIFGYGDETVGTINLTNGGTLHNDSTENHITVGAAVNMNNGVISAENGSGDNRFGNYVFDNAINVQGGTDNEINANKISLRQYGGTPGNGGGKITVAQDAQLTISSQIIDPDSNLVPLVKQGAGTLILSGDNAYTTATTVSEGTLALTGDAIKANSSIEIAENATLEYNVAANDERAVDYSAAGKTVSGGNVLKSGTGKLKIKADGEQFSSDQFLVSAGELDFKGQYNGDLAVQRGATLSPGNSVGDLTVYGNVTIDAGATGLFEFSAYNENQFDTLTIANADNAFLVDTNSIIKLYFEGNDADLWAADGAEYKLVSDEGFVSATTDLSSLLGNFTNLFGLEGRTDGLYLVALNGPIPPEPGSGVPEPSTWALLALGVVVLLLRKRVRN